MDFNKGQHLLIDKRIIQEMIFAAKISEKDKIIEIGAGTGNITKELAKTNATITSFEIDDSFKEDLKEINKQKNIKVIFGDGLKPRWKDANKIVANIPFHLSEKIIEKSIKENVKRLVLVVGEKFLFGIKKRTKFGEKIKTFYDVNVLKRVKKESFEPMPKEDSWLLVLNRKESPSKEEKIFQDIILYEGKLKNAIVSVMINLRLTKRQSRASIEKIKIEKEYLEMPYNKIPEKTQKDINNILRKFLNNL